MEKQILNKFVSCLLKIQLNFKILLKTIKLLLNVKFQDFLYIFGKLSFCHG